MEDYIENCDRDNGQISLNTQISNMNMELKYFLEKFTEFTQSSHFLDENMHKNLEKVLDSVEQFLDNRPYLITSDNNTMYSDFNFSFNTIEKRLFCNICQEYLIDSAKPLRKHLLSNKHTEGLKILTTGDKIKIKEFISNRKVESLIDAKTFQKIVQRTEIKIKKEQTAQQNIPKKAKKFLLSDLYNFSKEKSIIAKKLANDEIFSEVTKAIKASLSFRYPRASYYFHGSRISLLADDNSNINIFIDVGGFFLTYKPKPDVILKIMSDINCILQANQKIWSNIAAHISQNPQVLVAFNKELKINFNLTFANGLDYCKTGLIKELFTKQPICQRLCLIVKQWIKESSLEAHFPLYLITMLVIFYCQIKRIVPPIHLLQSTVLPVLIGPWQINFDTKPFEAYGFETLPITKEQTQFHLHGFFEYYADFKYDDYVICPYLAHTIGRAHFNKMQSLPRYQLFIAHDPSSAFKLNLNTPIVIQDPIEQNCNITLAISKGCLELFRNYCYRSAQILKNKPLTK